MNAAIINRGRGPEIEGTRITVYDIFYHLKNSWDQAQIAEVLRLSLDQVRAAVAYIEEHKSEVMAVHQEIEERNARGNPPEIEAKLEVGRIRLQQLLQKIRERKALEANGAGNPCGQ